VCGIGNGMASAGDNGELRQIELVPCRGRAP